MSIWDMKVTSQLFLTEMQCGWITVPAKMKLPEGQQERDMLARELLIKKFQMSSSHPLVALKKTYVKGDNFRLNE